MFYPFVFFNSGFALGMNIKKNQCPYLFRFYFFVIFTCLSVSPFPFTLNGAQNLIMHSYFLMQNNIRVVDCLIMQQKMNLYCPKYLSWQIFELICKYFVS